MEFGKEYYMYSSDISLGACKIFSYNENSPYYFNIDIPPIFDMALSDNLFVTTKLIVRKQLINLADDEKLNIVLNDISNNVPAIIFRQK
jgi:hypothetical protein